MMNFTHKTLQLGFITSLLMLMLLTPHANASSTNSLSNEQSFSADIAIKLNLKQQQGEYHPPYVAAWIENKQRKSVRTLLLWRKEPKWLKDIRRWWRNVGRKSPELVDAITSATHAAGTFPLSYKANNDQGEALPNGQYTLYIEVVREKGGRALLKQAFSIGENTQQFTLKATAETGPITFTVNSKESK